VSISSAYLLPNSRRLDVLPRYSLLKVSAYELDVRMGMALLVGMGFPWDSHVNGNVEKYMVL